MPESAPEDPVITDRSSVIYGLVEEADALGSLDEEIIWQAIRAAYALGYDDAL